LFLGSRTGLGAPVLEQWLNGRGAWQSLQVSICPSVLVGAALSVLITILEQAIFAARMPEVRVRPEIPLWQTILACFYGGITEELLTRFGLLTALAWLFGMISNTAESLPSDTAIWTAIIIAAIAFGLGHLPATARLVPLTPVVVVRALILNGVPGIAFGYLYWTHGLEAAVLAHLTTDIMLQVLIAPLYRRFSRQ
jgi:membrane protease YdiL (CAAX protease family)